MHFFIHINNASSKTKNMLLILMGPYFIVIFFLNCPIFRPRCVWWQSHISWSCPDTNFVSYYYTHFGCVMVICLLVSIARSKSMLNGFQMLIRFSTQFLNWFSQWNQLTLLNVRTRLKIDLKFSHDWKLIQMYIYLFLENWASFFIELRSGS